MGAWLLPEDLPGMDEGTAFELIDELEAYLSLHYPCLVSLPEETKPTLKALLKPVVRRWDDAGTGLTVQTTDGPFGERKSGGGGHILWEHEKESLRALCAAPAAGVPLPRGSFPPPEPIGDLFARRPGWP